MKKVIFKAVSVFMAILVLMVQTQSLSAKNMELGIPDIDEAVFELNEEALSVAMLQLNELDNYLAQNEGTTYADLALADSDLITNVSDTTAPMGMSQGDDDLMGIPAFLWGCVLGWVGLLLVYILTDNDKAQVKKALTGCLVSTAVGVAFYVVYIVWIVTEVDNITYY